MIDRLILLAIGPLTLAGGALGVAGWGSVGSEGDSLAALAMDKAAFEDSDSPADSASDARASSGVTKLVIRRSQDQLFRIPAHIGPHSLDLIVDTGATYSTISRSTARQIGLADGASGSAGRLMTLNGSVSYRRVTAPAVTIAGRIMTDVDFVVVDSQGVPPVLGQNLLSRLGPMTLDRDELTL